MVQAFERANAEWSHTNLLGQETRAYKGAYVSGNTKYTDDNPINELKTPFPQALAGDMEGHGLASACQKYQKPWLLMKGISDFGKREEDNEDRQKDAATASAKALLNILNDIESEHLRAIVPEGSVNYYYHGIKYRINNIFFQQYMPEVEDYYIERGIDKKIGMLIKTGCCWIYGKSGVGKSVSISRALFKDGIPYVLCDLTRYSHSPVEEIFKYIYGNICLFTKETPVADLQNYDQIVDELFAVVKRHYENSTLYVLIEEIPFNFGSDQFLYFFDKLNALIISSKLNLGNSRLEFVLSTIDTPQPYLQQWQVKIKNTVKFIEMEQWTMAECEKLTDLLIRITNLQWETNYSKQDFIKVMDYSPARIKKTLNDLVMMDMGAVSREMIELLGTL